MSLFDDSDAKVSGEMGGRQIRATGHRDKLPETPDFTQWGAPIRKSSPFLLDDFSSGAPVNTTKP
jgi:hypothetical protein